MIQWNKIKNDYPAAWEAFIEWCETAMYLHHAGGLYYSDVASYSNKFDERDLYDFFDEKGIYVVVELDQMGGSNGKPSFLATIFNSDPSADEEECLDGNFKTRTEAESAAFERSFSILNNQLLGE